MVRVPKFTSLERIVGGTSIDCGAAVGPNAEAFLAELDRQLAILDANKLRDHQTDDPEITQPHTKRVR